MLLHVLKVSDSKVHGADMGAPGSCRPQMDPMLAPWILLSGVCPWSLPQSVSLSLSVFLCLSVMSGLSGVFPLWKHWVLPLHTATIAGTMSTRNTQYKHLTSLYSLLITYAAHVSASIQWVPLSMMTSWHENYFHITGHLWGESSGRASDILSVRHFIRCYTSAFVALCEGKSRGSDPWCYSHKE